MFILQPGRLVDCVGGALTARGGGGLRSLIAVAGVIAVLSAGGCASITGSSNPLFESLMPAAPGEVARDAFNVYDADTRRESVHMLSSAHFGGEAPYVRLYRLLIDDPDPTVRAACVKALGMHGSVEDAVLLANLLEDDAALVRWESAKALQRVHNPAAVAPLMNLVSSDEDADVRMAAAYALGQYNQAKVFHCLVGALDDHSYGVTQASRWSLGMLTGYDFGDDGSLWLIWAKKNAGGLFEHGREYVWQPYDKPRGWWDKAKFWKKSEPVQPRPPRGLADSRAGLDDHTP